jgi:uncharacterized membrane protein
MDAACGLDIILLVLLLFSVRELSTLLSYREKKALLPGSVLLVVVVVGVVVVGVVGSLVEPRRERPAATGVGEWCWSAIFFDWGIKSPGRAS